uniref:Protein kinase putative n=1 Tax=Albugo laibachii Nc14 TaxID=890382 RepID=F0W409_9STRA|nr:protein kinase putative [Albugo laibachii Nc14]|eukprot:CCA15806.1 protein kinase putative [Albugo laibachii Nc14]
MHQKAHLYPALTLPTPSIRFVLVTIPPSVRVTNRCRVGSMRLSIVFLCCLPVYLVHGQSVLWCTDPSNTVLTTCGQACETDQPCVQYAKKATCNEASRNECKSRMTDGSACLYQCLNTAYNTAASKFTVFVKEPKATDHFDSDGAVSSSAFPSATVTSISSSAFSSEVRIIQITGFDSTSVQRGSIKSVDLSKKPFKDAALLETLVLTNLDLSAFPEDLVPKTTLSSLWLENCNLVALPAFLASITGLTELVLSKNKLESLSDGDEYTKALEAVTSLDVSENSLHSFDWNLPQVVSLNLANNALSSFPKVIFTLAKLNTLNLDGNQIKKLTITTAQANFLKRLNDETKLGILSMSGSCGGKAIERRIHDSIVCVDDSSGSNKTTIIAVCVSVALALLLVAGAVFWYRRKKSSLEYLNSPTFATMERAGGRVSRVRSVSGRRSSMAFAVADTPPQPKEPHPIVAKRVDIGLGIPSWDRKEQGGSTACWLQTDKVLHGHSNNSAPVNELPQRRSSLTSRQISPNVVQLPKKDIVFTRRLAKGAFGEVWLAHLQMGFVAIKKLITVDTQSIAGFIAELNLLASFNHPRIIQLIGATWDETFSDLHIVTEYMNCGDLLTVLRQKSPEELTWADDKAFYCLQICEAICYLHSLQPALIHRDIKSRNVLIDSVKGAKLTDFGESRERTFQHTMTAGVGTARWVAPEIILGEDYSELADIYSFGVLLSELDTHMIPYENSDIKEEAMIVQQVAVGKLRPSFSETCPETIKRLAHECLQFDPTLRPPASRLLQALRTSPLLQRAAT